MRSLALSPEFRSPTHDALDIASVLDFLRAAHFRQARIFFGHAEKIQERRYRPYHSEWRLSLFYARRALRITL